MNLEFCFPCLMFVVFCSQHTVPKRKYNDFPFPLTSLEHSGYIKESKTERGFSCLKAIQINIVLNPPPQYTHIMMYLV